MKISIPKNQESCGEEESSCDRCHDRDARTSSKRDSDPDRGKEFAKHPALTEELKIAVYFPDPHAPWQRGTNENTNGLLREYFPKGSDLTDVEESVIQDWENKLNNRPRKCLNWKTPYEVFYETSVHLI